MSRAWWIPAWQASSQHTTTSLQVALWLVSISCHFVRPFTFTLSHRTGKGYQERRMNRPTGLEQRCYLPDRDWLHKIHPRIDRSEWFNISQRNHGRRRIINNLKEDSWSIGVQDVTYLSHYFSQRQPSSCPTLRNPSMLVISKASWILYVLQISFYVVFGEASLRASNINIDRKCPLFVRPLWGRTLCGIRRCVQDFFHRFPKAVVMPKFPCWQSQRTLGTGFESAIFHVPAIADYAEKSEHVSRRDLRP